jgi:hypothetical protein
MNVIMWSRVISWHCTCADECLGVWQVISVKILVLVDMSNSVQRDISQVRGAIVAFIDQAQSRLSSANVELGVFGFDGSERILNLLKLGSDFTTDLAAARATIDTADLKNRDPSTNLYGAISEALGKFDGSRAQVNYMLVFTDGTDQAGYVSKADAEKKAASSKATIFVAATAGEQNEAAMANIATGGLEILENISQLSQKFLRAAGYVGLLSGNVFVFLYCSPRRRGTTTVKLHFNGKPVSEGFSVDASSFSTSGDEVCNQVLELIVLDLLSLKIMCLTSISALCEPQ